MFSLTIVFGPGPMVWTLMYKTEERAREELTKVEIESYKVANVVSFSCTDDFGQTCTVKYSELAGYMLEDVEQSKLAHIERALHAMRVKVKGDEMSRADPVIRAAAMQGGAGILQPSMPMAPNGGWRG